VYTLHSVTVQRRDLWSV